MVAISNVASAIERFNNPKQWLAYFDICNAYNQAVERHIRSAVVRADRPLIRGSWFDLRSLQSTCRHFLGQHNPEMLLHWCVDVVSRW